MFLFKNRKHKKTYTQHLAPRYAKAKAMSTMMQQCWCGTTYPNCNRELEMYRNL